MKKMGIVLLICLMLGLPGAEATTFSAVHAGSAVLFDETGALLCEPGLYSEILPLTDGLFAAKGEKGWLVLDDTGEPTLEIEYEDVYAQNGQIYLKKDGLYAVADAKMRLVTQHLYTQIVPNGEGGYLALKTDPDDDRGDGVYLIGADGGETATGTVIVYGLNDFTCGLSAAVGSGGKKTGYLSPEGTWAVTAQYGYGAGFTEFGLAAASADSGAGVIDTQGNWVVSPKFESVCLWPGNALIAVCAADGRVGLMNALTREPVREIPEGYARVRGLEDMALVTHDGQAVLYGLDGEVIAQWPEQSGASVRSIGNGYLLLHTDEGDCLLDGGAQQIAGPYEKLRELEGDVFAGSREGACDLIVNGEVIGTEFERITPAGEGLYLAWSADGGALIGPDGRAIVKLARN